jgi:anti-sigma regulatory factor (Ser/Thr protein kinase)
MNEAAMTADLADAVVTDHCHLRIPSLPEWIEPTIEYLLGRAQANGAVHPKRATRLMMALHEALTNSVIHGNLGISSVLKEQGDDVFARAVAERCADPVYACRVVDISATYNSGSATWIFTDQGAGFDVATVLRRLDSDEPDLTRPSGRGLLMIRAFVDEMRYEEGGRRLILQLHSQGEEKRVLPRWSMTRDVIVSPLNERGQVDELASQHALARNISQGGIGLLQTQLAPSSRILIAIPLSRGSGAGAPSGSETISVQAEVRNWHVLGDGIIEVGCRFETPLPAAPVEVGSGSEPQPSELDRLMHRLAEQQQPSVERRSAPRVSYTACVGVTIPGGSRIRGFARDLSRAGIAFVTTSSLPLDVVHLRLPADDVEGSIHVRARIVRCTRVGDGFYDVAAIFLTP